MKKVYNTFQLFLSEITHDFMLTVCMIGPMFMGVAFRFLLPVLENILGKQFGLTQILTPYYRIFDILLAIMTPILFCFAGVLVILEELDSGVAKYYFVTPLGKRGYLFSRVGVPAVIALVYDIILLMLFTISEINIFMSLTLSISGVLIAMITSLIVISFASNKMEGMALVKLCGLLIIGVPVAYFVSSPIRYFFGMLPSFWMAESCVRNNNLFFLPTLLSSIVMISALYRRFQKKICN